MRRPEPYDGAPLRVLLRHADAGVRGTWSAADDWRVLSPLGRVEADRVVARIDGLPILRVMSSPSLRCRQTVVPLARYLGLDIEPRRELAADVGPSQLLRFLADPETECAVLCTHRETLETLFAELAVSRAVVAWVGATMEKAAAWLVRGAVDDRTGFQLQYLPARAAPWLAETVAGSDGPGAPDGAGDRGTESGAEISAGSSADGARRLSRLS